MDRRLPVKLLGLSAGLVGGRAGVLDVVMPPGIQPRGRLFVVLRGRQRVLALGGKALGADQGRADLCELAVAEASPDATNAAPWEGLLRSEEAPGLDQPSP